MFRRRFVVWAWVLVGCSSAPEPPGIPPGLMLDDAGRIIVPSTGGSPGLADSSVGQGGAQGADARVADAAADSTAPDMSAPPPDMAAPADSATPGPDAPAADAAAPDVAAPDAPPAMADAPVPDVAAAPGEDSAAPDLPPATDDAPVGDDSAPAVDMAPATPTADALDLTKSKPSIYALTGDKVTLTATAKKGKKLAGPGVPITFSTSRGVFVDDGGNSLGMQTIVNDGADGKASIRLMVSDAGAGVANVTASCPNATAMVTVTVVAIQQISHVATTCGSATCSVMGIKGSGFNEQARVAFKVIDSAGNPVVGTTVDFMLVAAPPGTMLAAAADATDDTGQVIATVASGPLIGAFSVHAQVRGTSVEGVSPTVGVRGAKPANRGFTLQCSPVNIGAYTTALPPTDIDVTCTVTLVDRFGNPIGTGASVYLRSEAGKVPFSVPTKAYNPVANSDEGTATFIFNTKGVFPAQDVAPLPADPAQWPRARQAEPSAMDGALVRNPRDGLVTLLAYIRGEEFFQDDNANGTRDGNEMFVDQGEPFVDTNDSGTWEPGKAYVDESPGDSQWNGPNGTWDSSTMIWTETRVLFSGFAGSGAGAGFRITPDPFGPVPVNGNTVLKVYAADPNGNVPSKDTAFIYSFTGMRGGLHSSQPTKIPDGFGFDIERRMINAADGTDCTAATPVCLWRMLFYNWSAGYIGDLKVLGASMAGADGPTPATVDGKMLNAGPDISTSAAGTVE